MADVKLKESFERSPFDLELQALMEKHNIDCAFMVHPEDVEEHKGLNYKLMGQDVPGCIKLLAEILSCPSRIREQLESAVKQLSMEDAAQLLVELEPLCGNHAAQA